MSRLGLILTASILAAGGAAGAEIRLRSQCQAAGAIVTLGDLAEIFGDDATQRQRLAAIELGPAPGFGQQRYFRLRELQDSLHVRGVNLFEHHFSGYGQTLVSRPDEAQIEEPAPKEIKEEAKVPEPPELLVPVVVPARPIPRGVVVRPEDLQISTVPPAKAREAFCSMEEVVGREAARALTEGRPLDRGALRSPLLVRRGEMITLTASGPGVKVKMTARAREHGGLGEPVLVESLPERRVLLARVVGFQEAEVFRHQPAAFVPGSVAGKDDPRSGSR